MEFQLIKNGQKLNQVDFENKLNELGTNSDFMSESQA
jgi:hypothetical protein